MLVFTEKDSSNRFVWNVFSKFIKSQNYNFKLFQRKNYFLSFKIKKKNSFLFLYCSNNQESHYIYFVFKNVFTFKFFIYIVIGFFKQYNDFQFMYFSTFPSSCMLFSFLNFHNYSRFPCKSTGIHFSIFWNTRKLSVPVLFKPYENHEFKLFTFQSM